MRHGVCCRPKRANKRSSPRRHSENSSTGASRRPTLRTSKSRMCRCRVSTSSLLSRGQCNESYLGYQSGSDAEPQESASADHPACYEEVARQAECEQLSYERYLHELVQRECEDRQENRTTKMLRESQLPLEKSLEAFDTRRLPPKAARQMRALLDGGFLERTDNVLVFGNPDPATFCTSLLHS